MLLILLSPLADVRQLNSAFYHATTANMSRRKDIIWQSVTVHVVSGTHGPTDWDNFISKTVVPLLHVGPD